MGVAASAGLSKATKSVSEADLKAALAGMSEEDRRKILSCISSVQSDLEHRTVIFVLGGPGSGKGTQCEKMVNTYGFKHLSAGDLLRAERKKPGSDLGEMIERHITSGTLVPAEITVKLLMAAISEERSTNKFLVDGFPRNHSNLDTWYEVVGDKLKLTCVLFFECSTEEMEVRLLERGKTSGRSDDNADVIRKRFRTFLEESMPVIQRMEGHGLVRRINAMASIEDVWKDVQKVIDIELGRRAKPKRMTILHFNDVYNVEPRTKEPVGGIARFVTRVRELKAASIARGEPEAVVLFSGDAFNPSLTSTVTKGKHMVPALNAIGIHTACYGNHDFDFGVNNLADLASQNNFPWLISNVIAKDTGRPLAEGLVSRILNFHGRKVGIIGLVEREWLVTLATLDPSEVDFEDFCECARRLARQLKEHECVEIVVALTHMRVPNDELLAHEVPEVDIILGGHDHHYDVKPVGPHGTWVLKSGTDFRDITEITVEFNDKGRGIEVVACEHHEIVGSIAEDPEMKKLSDKCMADVGEAMDVDICATLCDLDARFQSIRTQETGIGNFVTDVMRLFMKADLAVLNSGTLRADAIIEKGHLKMRDLVSILPMLDEVCLLEISGADILLVLENAVCQYPRLEGRFAQVSGVKFTFDAARPAGRRVVEGSVFIGGAPMEVDKLYTLVTKDYLRQGKDGYDVFRRVKCLADGEQAGILPSMVREMFEQIDELATLSTEGNLRRSQSKPQACRHAATLASCGVVQQVSASPLKYGIAPTVEGRIVCLNAAS